MITQKLLRYAQKKIKRLFADFNDASHDFGHTSRVVFYSREISEKEGRDSGLSEMAAWLHDIGRVAEHTKNPAGWGHNILSEELARQWFQTDKHFAVLSPEEKKEILYAVKNHGDDLARDYPSAVILRDADKLDLYGAAGLARHKAFHAGDIHELYCNVVAALERAARLKTAAGKKILKKRKLLKPLKDFLKKGDFNEKARTRKVLCAISGGVDSAVAAFLLKKAGYEVVGAFMKCYSEAVPGGAAPCWIEDRREALRVAAKLEIKMIELDFEKEYRRDVVDYLFKEYRVGRTPNPDVMCNKYVKIPLLLKTAEKLGFDFIATGHYARLRRSDSASAGRPAAGRKGESAVKLSLAADQNKDQTYFLHQMGQKELRRLIFPIGALCKDEVRTFARQWGLPVAEREESMGICFIGEMPMKKFLLKKIKPRCGPMVLSNGKKVGEHQGLAFYTIGEKVPCHFKRRRRISYCSARDSSPRSVGARNDNKRALYAVAKDIKHNRLIIGYDDDPLLFKKKIGVRRMNWIAGQAPKFPLKCKVRSRHRQLLQSAVLLSGSGRANGNLTINFGQLQRAAAPGQFAVIYKNGECLGGGKIV